MIEMHVCYSSDVIEGAPPAPKKPSGDFRTELLNLWGVTQMVKSFPRWVRKVKDLEVLCYYAIEVPSTRKRKPMDVKAMIENWRAVIVTLCTAHTKDEIDAAEYRMDELLKPILGAPVAQLREFYAGLQEALKADPQVPFFIWSMFRAWGKVIVDDCEDKTKRVRLRKKLATEIAEMVEPDVKPDITAAIVGALMWRDPETLEQIKGDLQAGARPRLRGRESCLFLVTEKGRGAKARELHKVML